MLEGAQSATGLLVNLGPTPGSGPTRPRFTPETEHCSIYSELVRMRGPKHIRKASKESNVRKVSKTRKISTAVTADE